MLVEIKPLWELLEHYFREARKLVEGLSTEQLNWKPLEGDAQSEASNSLYGIALHIAFVSMSIAANIAGQPPPDYPEMRNGNSGLETVGESPERAIELLNEAQTYVEDILNSITPEQLEEMRERHAGNWVGEPKSVRWLLLHMLDHTALHVGHMEITHQFVVKQL